jgi:hypothetical protein
MIEGWISWTVIVVLLIAVFGVLRLHRIRVAALQETHANDKTSYERRLQASADKHLGEMAQARDVHNQSLRDTVSATDARLAEAVAARVDAEERAELFHKMATRNVDWDLRSRALILKACENLELQGVLATNVMFVPDKNASESPFVVQIDHVLMTESFAMVIENKGWAGVVFDGIKPSSEHDAFGMLVNEDDLDGAYSVQIIQSNGTKLDVRTHVRSASPRSQVRRHSSQLKKHLEPSNPRIPWLRTCVLYSNSRLRLYAAPNPPASDDNETSVSSSLAQLQSLLSGVDKYERRRGRRVMVKALGEQLSHIAGDMCGFGRYAETWQSPL